MGFPSSKDIENIIGYFKHYIRKADGNSGKLNKIFYYSLFDYSTIFESPNPQIIKLFPLKAQRAYKKEMRSLLEEVFPKKTAYLKKWEEFELHVINSDKLSRIILLVGLSHQGVKVEPKISEADGSFDLELENNTKLELKRIWSWTNYDDYVKELCNKICSLDKTENNSFLFVVASPYPFVIEDLFGGRKEIDIFNNYIQNVIASHHVDEFLLKKHLQCANIKFIIQHIDKYGASSYHINKLCVKIGQKIGDRYATRA